MSKYFKNIEEGMDVNFLAKLDEAREYANIPFIINSAYRSPEHPLSISNPTSSHIKGLAVDISVKDSRQRFLVLDALIAVGFNRIGIAGTFIHVDLSVDKVQNVIWTY
jgi:zinc D-Ala-D-Ala carboxypeptidase